MATILWTICSNAFSWMKIYGFWFKFTEVCSKDPINNIPGFPTWVQIMAWRWPGGKPLYEPMMVRLPMYIWVTQPQLILISQCFLCTFNVLLRIVANSTESSLLFSQFKNSLLGLAGGKHYQKIIIPIFRLVPQNFALPCCFLYILCYPIYLFLLSSGWVVITVCGSISVQGIS